MVMGYTLLCPLPPLYSNPGSAPGWGIAYNATFKDRKKETYGVFGLRNEVVTIIFSFLTFFICLARDTPLYHVDIMTCKIKVPTSIY
jgi:hypothetical protein